MPTPAGRDQGYRRIRKVTGWAAAGSMAAVAAVAAVVGVSIPGHSSRASTRGPASSSSSSVTVPSDSQPTFTAPSEAPTQTFQQPVASSGAS